MNDLVGAGAPPTARGASTPPNSVAVVLWTIVISTAVRIATDSVLGYGPGEGYYLASARHLALSYFDHPPLSMWIAHAAIGWFGTGSILLPRLPFILIFSGTTWLMYRLGARLFGEAAGAWSAVLLNLSPLFMIMGGSWVEPDVPLFFFLTLATIPIVDLCFGAPKRPGRLWALAGLSFGLAMLSKYYAALILVGLLIFVATTPAYRAWFFNAGVVIAGLIGAAVFAPVLIWNLDNHWVSFAFQGGRFLDSSGLRFDWLVRSILGQALLIGIVIWPLMMVVFAKALRAGPSEPKSWFLCCLAIVPIILFTAAALLAPIGARFHWQGPGYLFLFPLLGKSVAEGVALGRKAARNWLIASGGLLILFAGLAGAQAATGWTRAWLPSGIRKQPFSQTNPTQRLLGWRQLRSTLAERGLLDQDRLFVVTTEFRDAGKADVAVGDRLPVVCLCADPRNIAFSWDDRAFLGWDAVIVVPGDENEIPSAYREYFNSIERLGDVDIPLGGETALTIHLFLAHGYQRAYPMPYGISR
jgi:Dolichyl-phosphate-mannose-protein mannosyltransferase